MRQYSGRLEYWPEGMDTAKSMYLQRVRRVYRIARTLYRVLHWLQKRGIV